jgi:hypothetical protein
LSPTVMRSKRPTGVGRDTKIVSGSLEGVNLCRDVVANRRKRARCASYPIRRPRKNPVLSKKGEKNEGGEKESENNGG